jgi:hypothetical protein
VKSYIPVVVGVLLEVNKHESNTIASAQKEIYRNGQLIVEHRRAFGNSANSTAREYAEKKAEFEEILRESTNRLSTLTQRIIDMWSQNKKALTSKTIILIMHHVKMYYESFHPVVQAHLKPFLEETQQDQYLAEMQSENCQIQANLKHYEVRT